LRTYVEALGTTLAEMFVKLEGGGRILMARAPGKGLALLIGRRHPMQ
jgi:hypothetical protein